MSNLLTWQNYTFCICASLLSALSVVLFCRFFYWPSIKKARRILKLNCDPSRHHQKQLWLEIKIKNKTQKSCDAFNWSLITTKRSYSTLTRFWPNLTPLWSLCIKGGYLCRAEMGSSTFAWLANYSAHHAKLHSQGMPKARQKVPDARQCTVLRCDQAFFCALSKNSRPAAKKLRAHFEKTLKPIEKTYKMQFHILAKKPLTLFTFSK